MPLLPATLSQNIIVDTALGNQTLAVTYAGAGAATFAITGITYTVNGVSSVAIPDLTFTYDPAIQDPPVYSAAPTVTIGGKYSLSIFDQNLITAIPRGGTDKDVPSTVTTTRSFAGLVAANKQVFKLSPDNRTITVVYTVAYSQRVIITGTTAPGDTAPTGGSNVVTAVTATISQTVVNNYDALSAALLLVI